MLLRELSQQTERPGVWQSRTVVGPFDNYVVGVTRRPVALLITRRKNVCGEELHRLRSNEVRFNLSPELTAS